MADSKISSATSWLVKVDGAEVRDETMALLLQGVVEDNLRLPDMVLLSFFDPGRDVVSGAGFQLGKQIDVLAYGASFPAGVSLFKGEITAMEAQLDGDKPLTIIRGYDKTNRLYRGRKTKTFVNVTYSDVVRKVVAENGLQVGTIDNTRTVHDHVAQAGMSDAEFLSMLAGEVGFVLTTTDGRVDFLAPPSASQAPAAGRRRQQAPLQLVPGEDLLQFSSVVTADSAVRSVEVYGWDINRKEAVVGTAPAVTSTAAVGVRPSDIAAKFGGQTFKAGDVPFGTSVEVTAVAKALADQIAGTHAQLYGVSVGNPALKAGVAVSLGATGSPFDGKYTLTLSRHVYEDGLYRTHFSSSGTHERSLAAMASGGGDGSTNPSFVTGAIPGVVTAIVTDVKQDGNGALTGLARCKVKIPQFGPDFVTDWLRVVSPGAGAGRGLTVLPEVNDEVVVAFDHGDIRRGYVLGGVFNGRDQPAAAAFGGVVNGNDGKVDRRAFTSRTGNFLLFSDKQGQDFVELATAGSKHSIKLDKDGKVIVVNSDKEITVDSKGNITIKAAQNGNITIEATGDLTLKGRKVSVQAQTNAEVKGVNLKLEGSAQAEMKAVNAKVAGTAMLDLNGGPLAQLKGAIVKIN